MTRPILVAGMATRPSRSSTAPAALESLLAQFDRIHLTLNEYERIPAWARRPGVVATLAAEDRGAAGKLDGLAHERDPATVYFCTDDDIVYPANFARRLCALLDRKGRCLVGVHGSTMRRPFRSWRDDRKVVSFEQGMWFSRRVDVVATCGCAFRPHELRVDPTTWPGAYRNCVDLYLATLAARQGVPGWIVARRRGWMRALAVVQQDSIFRRMRQDDSLHTALALDLLESKDQVMVHRDLEVLPGEKPEQIETAHHQQHPKDG